MTSEHTPDAVADPSVGVCMYRWFAPRPEDIANGDVTTDVQHVCMLPGPGKHKGAHVCSCGSVTTEGARL